MCAILVCCSALHPDRPTIVISKKIKLIDKNDDLHNDDNNVESDDMDDMTAAGRLHFFSTDTSRTKTETKKEERHRRTLECPPYRFLHISYFLAFGIAFRQ